MQLLVAKRRTHAAKRERPDREARAFTLILRSVPPKGGNSNAVRAAEGRHLE